MEPLYTPELEFNSLYEFLGKPAGQELGNKVAQAAMNENIPIKQREVQTKTYTGLVCLYPTEWLKEYFKYNKV
jgi:hypothetical protein